MPRARSFIVMALLALLPGCAEDSPPAVSDELSSPAQSGTSTTGPRCENGAWPSVVNGVPSVLEEGPSTGYYVWHGFLGWSLRTVDTDAEPRTFRGSVVASGPSISAKPFPADAPVQLAVAGNRLDFEIPSGPEPQGFDLVVGCQSTLVRFELNGPSGPWPLEGIFLGGGGSAYGNPLVIERQQ
jgi:hypothetical protein